MIATEQELLNIAKRLGPVDREIVKAAARELSERRRHDRFFTFNASTKELEPLTPGNVKQDGWSYRA
jgi:hypothetical protein